ncbi:MAG: RNase adapter RapZ [Andreesenia angusta]|nr:RNase adapter RapZ [Andreesenia angusta]
MQDTKFILIVGLSGAGKSQALKVFEDQGYHSVGNLPPALLEDFINLYKNEKSDADKVALIMNSRGIKLVEELEKTLEKFKEMDVDYNILFMDASDEALIKRFKELRRPHPFDIDGNIVDGIKFERKELHNIKKEANAIIDTSDLNLAMLKEKIFTIFFSDMEKVERMSVNIVSFGFKYGIPKDADLVFDVRFLTNPYYVEELRPLTGNDKEVRDFVMMRNDSRVFLEKLEDMVEFLIPRYIKEGKSQLVIAIGCTGGQHRSVTIANCLYEYLLKNEYKVKLRHREQEK